MARNKIEPEIVIILDVGGNLLNIPIIVRSKFSILHMTYITKSTSDYLIRKHLIEVLDKLISEYKPNMIILEQNKLLIDKMDRYPDPFYLRDILLGFSIKTSIDDRYHLTIPFILEIPQYDWRQKILNSNVKYSIDLYKSHIINQNLSSEELKIIHENNYYLALCLSESIWYEDLMKYKYQINKGD